MAQHAGNVGEHLVAVPVAVTVVDKLEVVEIHQRHRERLGSAHRVGDGHVELLLERAVVTEIRQRIARGAFHDAAVPLGERASTHHVEESHR